MHSLNKYLLSIYHVLDTLLGTHVVSVKKIDKNLCHHGTYLLLG